MPLGKFVLQDHLFKYPLFRRDVNNHGREQERRVLIIGFKCEGQGHGPATRNFGPWFLDLCLQMGQIDDRSLNVTVAYDEEDDKNRYLRERPALGEFFEIDGIEAQKAEGKPYGSIRFKHIEDYQQATLETIVSDCITDQQKTLYILVASGQALPLDALNQRNSQIATTVKDIAEIKVYYGIYFIWEGREGENPPDPVFNGTNEVVPILVRENFDAELREEINRMGFNAHLIWQKDYNIDIKASKDEFDADEKGYNRGASISNALSLKYKLHYMGIDMDLKKLAENVKEFKQRLAAQPTLKFELAWIEHRRWVTEKICDGARQLVVDDIGNNGRQIKDDQGCLREHVCIVDSTIPQSLAQGRWTDRAHWDTATPEEIQALDGLDRMSVELHRKFVKNAEERFNMEVLKGNMAAIRAQLGESGKVLAAFQEWYACVKDIYYHGNVERLRMYESLKKAFLLASESLPQAEDIKKQVDAIEAIENGAGFRLILDKMECRDYKEDDVALVDKIPFILTYSTSIGLAIPYVDGDTSTLLGNVAAATIINPARIVYLCHFSNKAEANQFKVSIPRALQYLKKRKVRLDDVRLIIAYDSAMRLEQDANFSEFVKGDIGLGNRSIRLRKVDWISYASDQDIAPLLKEKLDAAREGMRDFAIERNGTYLSGILEYARIEENGRLIRLADSFPHYRFNSRFMRFEGDENSSCNFFKDIPIKVKVTVSDIFELNQAVGMREPLTTFFENFAALFKKYRENTGRWKDLCSSLGDDGVSQVVIKFSSPLGSWERREFHRADIPIIYHDAIAQVLNFLGEEGFIERDSSVERQGDSCYVSVWYKSPQSDLEFEKNCRLLLDALSELPSSALGDAVHLEEDLTHREALVKIDKMTVRDALLRTNITNNIDAVYGLLRELGQECHISNLAPLNDGRVSFSYTLPQVHRLLTKEGNILEAYTYHKAKETGYFDEVVCGCEIQQHDIAIKQEIDCILIKGFTMIFVECKACRQIDKEFYITLSRLARKFGVNVGAVLVADTEENITERYRVHNSEERRYGETENVITIYEPERIADIGRTLRDIMKRVRREG